MTVALRVAKPRIVTPPASDADLVAAVRRGDARAFSEIYNAHADYVHGLLGRLIGPVVERDDLLQEVFVRLHRALATFRGESSLRTFVARIAVNLAHDHLRLRRRRREDFCAELDDLVSGVVDGVSRAALACDYAALLRCLEQIRPAKRVAFVLRVGCEMSYGEMAELLDIKPDAARQRVAHARRELAALLSREGIARE